MKSLYIGDVHCTLETMDDVENLINYSIDIANQEKVDKIVFLGDQYNFFSLIHTPVMAFWERMFKLMKEKTNKEIICLVGNHDLPGDKNSRTNSMMLHSNITVVNDWMVQDNILYLSYQHFNNNFIKICNENKHLDTVICHAEFDGARYENGFYSKHGINADLIPQKNVYTGHIHMPNILGKVHYLGSPRWITISDANQERFVWIINHETNEKKWFSTKNVCKPIYLLKDTPTDSVPEEYFTVKNAKITVDIHGPIDFITKRRTFFDSLNWKVRTFPEKNFTSEIKESEGVKVAFNKYLNGFTPKYGTSQNRLSNLLKERISWMN